MDVLGDVLKAIRLKGDIYFNACFCSPWGMNLKQDNKASFHIIIEGDAWLTLSDNQEQIMLTAGDIVLFPKGTAHKISDKADGQCIDANKVVESYQSGGNLFSGEKQAINIVCGSVEFDSSISHPFIEHLPVLIHITSGIRKQYNWLDNIINLLINETQLNEPGSAVLIDKYTEILFIQTIRAYTKKTEGSLNYITALNDKHISQALQLIHSTPSKDWTVEALATEIGLSRTSFYNKFNQLVGLPPMKYVFKWRMMYAKKNLEDTQKNMTSIAEEVGYQSDSAFQKAFKRFFKLTPAALRKNSKT